MMGATQRFHCLQGFFNQRGNFLAVVIEFVARLRQMGFAPDLVEQLYPQILLQLPYLRRYSRLTKVQLLSSSYITAVLGYYLKSCELMQVDITHVGPPGYSSLCSSYYGR